MAGAFHLFGSTLQVSCGSHCSCREVTTCPRACTTHSMSPYHTIPSRETCARRTRNIEFEGHNFGHTSPGYLRRTIPTTCIPQQDYQLQESHLRLCIPGRNPRQGILQNSGVQKPREWKTNFISEVWSSTSCLTEVVVWIHEVCSSRKMDELKSSQTSRYLIQKLRVPHFKRRAGGARGTTGQSILERKTNSLHDL